MNKLQIIIILFAISLVINMIIMIEYFEKHDITDAYTRLINSEKSLPLDPPKIPDFYKNGAMTLSFEKNVFTRNDFDQWKEKVISKFIDVYEIPPPEDIKIGHVEKIHTQDSGNYVVNKYTMRAVDNDVIIFYELLPNTISKSLPAVFVIPGSGNQGALDVINEPSNVSKYYYHKGIGKELVKTDYAVYVIENRGWGERTIDAGFQCDKSDVFCSGNVLNRQLENLGKNLYSLQVSDSIQVVRFIQTREYVDAKNVSVVGLSLGGAITQAVSALVPDIKNTVIASGLVSIYQTTGSGPTPGMLQYFDFPDLISTIAPRNLYLSWGENERSMFGYEANTMYSANLIKKAYTLFDATDNFAVIINGERFNDGHTFDVPSIIKFLKDHTD